MDTRKIKEVVTQMIVDGELQFELDVRHDLDYENWNDNYKIKFKLRVLDFVDNVLCECNDDIYLDKPNK